MSEREFWWATIHGHDRPEVVEVQIVDGKPDRVFLSGSDVDIEAHEIEGAVRLIEPVLPPGRVAPAIEKLADTITGFPLLDCVLDDVRDTLAILKGEAAAS